MSRTRWQLTQLLKKTKPRFGDRLQGVLELRYQSVDSMQFSLELSQAALNQIADEAEQVDFCQALPRDLRKLLGSITVVFILLAGVLLALSPKTLSNAALRYLFPFADIPRYTETRFTDIPETIYVARGEATAFQVRLENAEQLPHLPEASITLPRYPSQSVQYVEGYQFTLPAIQNPAKLSLRAGDAFESIRLIPQSRPVISRTIVEQVYPAYLGYPDRTLVLNHLRGQFLLGSRLKISLEANNSLKRIRSDYSFQIDQTTATMTIDELDEEVLMLFSLTDEYGLQSQRPQTLHLRAQTDQPPTIRLGAESNELIMLPHETVDFSLVAKDDFGLKSLGITWKSQDQSKSSMTLVTGTQQTRELSHRYAFNPALHSLPPSTYILQAVGLDYLPERMPVHSNQIKVHLLSLESHAEQVSGHFNHLLDDLDDTYAISQDQLFVAKRFKKASQKKWNESAFIAEMQAAQSSHKEAIKELIQHHATCMRILNEMFRNKLILRSLKLGMANLAQSLEISSDQSFPLTHNTYHSAEQLVYSPSTANQEFARAVILHEEALAELRDVIERARALKQVFETSTFAHRLKELARHEESLGNSIWEQFTLSGGVSPRDLDPAQLQDLALMEKKQQQLGQHLRWIEEDLRNYAQRNDQTKHRELAQKIVESSILDGFFTVQEALKSNHGYVASHQAQYWAEQLRALVIFLEGIPAASSGSGQGNTGDNNQRSSDQEQDTEFMLRLMDIVRTQKDLRGRTRALEQYKRTTTNHED